MEQRNDKTLTVIGVVKTVRSTYLSKADEGTVYMPKSLPNNYALLLLRTAGPPEASFRALNAALDGVNANLPSLTIMTAIAQTPMKVQLWMAEAPALAAAIRAGWRCCWHASAFSALCPAWLLCALARSGYVSPWEPDQEM